MAEIRPIRFIGPSLPEITPGAIQPSPIKFLGEAPIPEAEPPPPMTVEGLFRSVVRPTLETGGMIGGGLMGAPAGPVGALTGAGLGFAGG